MDRRKGGWCVGELSGQCEANVADEVGWVSPATWVDANDLAAISGFCHCLGVLTLNES